MTDVGTALRLRALAEGLGDDADLCLDRGVAQVEDHLVCGVERSPGEGWHNHRPIRPHCLQERVNDRIRPAFDMPEGAQRRMHQHHIAGLKADGAEAVAYVLFGYTTLFLHGQFTLVLRDLLSSQAALIAACLVEGPQGGASVPQGAGALPSGPHHCAPLTPWAG